MKHADEVGGALFAQADARILSWSVDGTIRIWDIARLVHGNLVEVACRLLADKDVSTLHKDSAIKVTEKICTDHGKLAPAPLFSELRD
jgi:hypothetical protein